MMGGMFNKTVRITTLNDTMLYPELRLDAEKVMIGTPEEVIAQGEDGYFIGKINFSVPFWGIFLNQPVVKVFTLENVFPVMNDPVWVLHTAYFEDASEEQDAAHNLYIQATYDQIPFNLSFGAVYIDGGYRFSDTTPVKGMAGDYVFEGILAPQDNRFLMQDIILGEAEHRIAGKVEGLEGSWQAVFKIGQGTDLQVNITSQINIEEQAETLDGEVIFNRLDLNDAQSIELFWQNIGRVMSDVMLVQKKIKLNVNSVEFADAIGSSMDANFTLTPKEEDISIVTFSGDIKQLPFEKLQPYLKEEFDRSGVVDVTFDMEGEFNFYPFRAQNITGNLHLVFADGSDDIDIPFHQTIFAEPEK